MDVMVKDDDDGGGFTGKRNKSWREIDARRGKSKYHSRQDDPAQQRIERSATYTRYKQAADALFTGGALPEGLAKTFDPEGKQQAQKDAMAKLRELPDRKAWAQGVIEYLEKYPELPEDPYFLDSLLDHPRERDRRTGAGEARGNAGGGDAEDEAAQEPRPAAQVAGADQHGSRAAAAGPGAPRTAARRERTPS